MYERSQLNFPFLYLTGKQNRFFSIEQVGQQIKETSTGEIIQQKGKVGKGEFFFFFLVRLETSESISKFRLCFYLPLQRSAVRYGLRHNTPLSPFYCSVRAVHVLSIYCDLITCDCVVYQKCIRSTPLIYSQAKLNRRNYCSFCFQKTFLWTQDGTVLFLKCCTVFICIFHSVSRSFRSLI